MQKPIPQLSPANSKPSPSARPSVLTIAGLDPAGMAGLAQDIRCQTALGAHTLPLISCNTVQNGQGLQQTGAIDSEHMARQLEALQHYSIAAIKIGLLGNIDQARCIERHLQQCHAPCVLDPVMSASAGGSFLASGAGAAYEHLLPHCDIVTPNREEAAQLTQQPFDQLENAPAIGERILARGAKAVLLKGGHFASEFAADYFTDGEQRVWIIQHRRQSDNTRGTGCALSSSIASALAMGYSLLDAIVIAKMAVDEAIQNSYATADAPAIQGPINCTAFPSRSESLPMLIPHREELSDLPWREAPWLKQEFPHCGPTPIGLYPVVDSSDWLARLLPLGVSTIQLRMKSGSEGDIENEIIRSIAIAKQYNARLFINDHWQLAIQHGAYGVHLGQEDLDTADVNAIYKAGLRLGISTHCHQELARAQFYQPSYIACGPIYATTSKDMPWIPHSAAGLSYWRRLIDRPLVAIGGINQQRIPEVINNGADGIAMISAITQASDPEQTCRHFISVIEQRDHHVFEPA